ncbi:MAG: hypothetical protein IIT37_01020 [Bacteroidales bacterium]|nr:hypothetical protein [Bacteroidales bacterium]
MKKFFLMMVFVLVASLTGFAQNTYEWKAYGLQVTLPSGMQVLQNTDELFMVGNTKTKIEIHAMEESLEDLSEDDVLAAIQSIGNNLNIDLAQSETVELECKNGSGFYLVAPHKTNPSLFGVICMADSNTSDVYVCVAGVATEADAEKFGQILGSITFKR